MSFVEHKCWCWKEINGPQYQFLLFSGFYAGEKLERSFAFFVSSKEYIEEALIFSNLGKTSFSKNFSQIIRFVLLLLKRRRLPPVTAWSTPLITIDKTRAGRDTRCPYSKIKLTKLPLNNSLDKFPPPSFYKIWYIFKIYYKYIYKPTHVYVSMCKIHTNSEQASIIRERI